LVLLLHVFNRPNDKIEVAVQDAPGRYWSVAVSDIANAPLVLMLAFGTDVSAQLFNIGIDRTAPDPGHGSNDFIELCKQAALSGILVYAL
jgi:hypothetical protein